MEANGVEGGAYFNFRTFLEERKAVALVSIHKFITWNIPCDNTFELSHCSPSLESLFKRKVNTS